MTLRPRFDGDSPEQGETQAFEFTGALGIYPAVTAIVYEFASGGIAVGEKPAVLLLLKHSTSRCSPSMGFTFCYMFLALRSLRVCSMNARAPRPSSNTSSEARPHLSRPARPDPENENPEPAPIWNACAV